jgi:hypothetical protein
MHHFGGKAWKEWNERMREGLLKEQEKVDPKMSGSWNATALGRWADQGGRLMATSLSLLTLEVYYRHLPLYYREAADKKQAQK